MELRQQLGGLFLHRPVYALQHFMIAIDQACRLQLLAERPGQ